MPMDLERRCFSHLLGKPSVVELSTWVRVAGCRWSILSRVIQMGTPFLHASKRDPHSASATDDTRLGIMVEVTRRALLFSSMVSASTLLR